MNVKTAASNDDDVSECYHSEFDENKEDVSCLCNRIFYLQTPRAHSLCFKDNI
jgi:hypothetical protein